MKSKIESQFLVVKRYYKNETHFQFTLLYFCTTIPIKELDVFRQAIKLYTLSNICVPNPTNIAIKIYVGVCRQNHKHLKKLKHVSETDPKQTYPSVVKTNYNKHAGMVKNHMYFMEFSKTSNFQLPLEKEK